MAMIPRKDDGLTQRLAIGHIDHFPSSSAEPSDWCLCCGLLDQFARHRNLAESDPRHALQPPRLVLGERVTFDSLS